MARSHARKAVPTTKDAAGSGGSAAAVDDTGADLDTAELTDEPAPSASDPLRIPHIFADLLPEEIINARRGTRARRRVIAALVGLTVLMAVWYGLAHYHTYLAAESVVAAEDGTRRLTRQQSEYDNVVKAQADAQAVSAQLAKLLANDLQWSALLASLQAAAPDGVTITTVSGSVGVAAEAGAPAGSSAGSPPVGVLTVSGTAPSKPAVAAYVDALATVPGTANPLLSDASQNLEKVQFTVRLELTKAALAGRFTPTKEAGTK